MYNSTSPGRVIPWARAAAFFGLLLAAATVSAAADGPAPPENVQAELGLELSGAGEFDVFIWDVYRAALWAPGGTYEPGESHALTLRYQREFEGEAIAERSISEIRELGIGSDTDHSRWLAAMKAIFPDVAEGDQLTGVHYPGSRAVFYRNGEPLGSVEEGEFARAFFAIWLDEQTNAPGLRARLLGMNESAGSTGGSR